MGTWYSTYGAGFVRSSGSCDYLIALDKFLCWFLVDLIWRSCSTLLRLLGYVHVVIVVISTVPCQDWVHPLSCGFSLFGACYFFPITREVHIAYFCWFPRWDSLYAALLRLLFLLILLYLGFAAENMYYCTRTQQHESIQFTELSACTRYQEILFGKAKFHFCLVINSTSCLSIELDGVSTSRHVGTTRVF